MDYSFLFWNLSGDFESLAQRIEKEGYDCYSYYEPSPTLIKGKKAGEGIINIVPDAFDVIRKFTNEKEKLIILLDDNSKGDMADYLKKEGWNVIGSSHISDLAEHEREFGTFIFEKVGINIPETHVFDDIDDAIKFVEENDEWEGFVFKANGFDFAGSSYTYVADDKEKMLFYLNNLSYLIRNGKLTSLDRFEIQKKIEGIEVSIAAYFNGEEFDKEHLFFDWEEKKIGYGNLGEATGCMGQVIQVGHAQGSYYFENYLNKLAPLLKEYGYVGEWDFNNIYNIDEDKWYALEHTPRFGWDSTMGELALLIDNEKSIAEFFIKLVKKESLKGFFPYDKISYARRLFVKSPNAKSDDVIDTPLDFGEYEDKFWFYSVSKNDDGVYIATDNPIAVLVNVGNDYDELVSESDDILKSVIIPNLYYRPDIATRYLESVDLFKDLEVLI